MCLQLCLRFCCHQSFRAKVWHKAIRGARTSAHCRSNQLRLDGSQKCLRCKFYHLTGARPPLSQVLMAVGTLFSEHAVHPFLPGFAAATPLPFLE